MDFSDLYADHGLLLATTMPAANTPVVTTSPQHQQQHLVGQQLTPSGSSASLFSMVESNSLTPASTPSYVDYTYDHKPVAPLPQQFLTYNSSFEPPPHPPPSYYYNNVGAGAGVDPADNTYPTHPHQPHPQPPAQPQSHPHPQPHPQPQPLPHAAPEAPQQQAQGAALQPPIKLKPGTGKRASKKSSNSSLPGPIPASTPTLVKRDEYGVEWISFEYSKDRVKSAYCIRCDIEKVDISQLADDFKSDNCIYPRATVPPDQYTGNRQKYETECNCIGWCLSYLNPSLRSQRGLIQRAVDSWRNTNADPSFRSRRVRRLSKKQTKPPTPGNRSKSVSNDFIPQSYSTPNLLDPNIPPFGLSQQPTFTNPFDPNHSVVYNNPNDLSPTSSRRTSSTTSLVQKRTASTIDTCPY